MSVQFELPVVFVAKILVTDGKEIATISYDLPEGLYPREADITVGINAALEAASNQLGPEWKLLDYGDFAAVIMSEKLAMEVNPPEGQWSKPYEAKRED